MKKINGFSVMVDSIEATIAYFKDCPLEFAPLFTAVLANLTWGPPTSVRFDYLAERSGRVTSGRLVTPHSAKIVYVYAGENSAESEFDRLLITGYDFYTGGIRTFNAKHMRNIRICPTAPEQKYKER